MRFKICYIFICFSIFFQNCTQDNFSFENEIIVNPSKIAPLCALVKIKASEARNLKVEVCGKNPIIQSFEMQNKELNFPVVGLYPGVKNKIALNFSKGTNSYTDTLYIDAPPVPEAFPEINIIKADKSLMEPGFQLCDIHYAQNGKYHSYPMVFDDEGVVRWYLDLSFFDKILWPIQKINNGNLTVAGRNKIFEFDMLGNKLEEYTLDPLYWIHHDVVEVSDNKILLPVGKPEAFIQIGNEKLRSSNEFIILYNKETNQIEKEWDVGEHLDVSRDDLNHFGGRGNWFHMNAIAFNPKDSSLIISGKHQGLVKISWDNKLEWIMAPHRNWGKAGRDGKGFETKDFLLTAISKNGEAYGSQIQDGSVSAADFDFPWGQHSQKILDNENILVFDNGSKRNYRDEFGYSRVVEYQVNQSDMTFKQVWQYGKEEGQDLFSLVISDADKLPKTGNVLMTSGYVVPSKARILEIKYPENKIVYEAELKFKTLNGNKTFSWAQNDILYRSERINLQYY